MEENIDNLPVDAGEKTPEAQPVPPIEDKPEEKKEEAPVEAVPVEPNAEEPLAVPPAEEKAEEAPKPVEGEKRWYVVQTFTGQEDKVKQAIEQTIQQEPGLKERVSQIL